MENKKRTLLRTLAGTTAGAGFVLALVAAGTDDFRKELISMDEENRALYDREIASEKEIMNMAITAAAMMGAGAVGFMLAGKKR
ncbi:MAG: hypothetical protein ACLRFO_04500 [Alphaproteobacteria bacterium]